MLHSQACDGADFSSYQRAMTETADHHLFQKVLPECNALPASSLLCILRRKRVGEVSDPPSTPTLSYDACGHKVFFGPANGSRSEFHRVAVIGLERNEGCNGSN